MSVSVQNTKYVIAKTLLRMHLSDIVQTEFRSRETVTLRSEEHKMQRKTNGQEGEQNRQIQKGFSLQILRSRYIGRRKRRNSQRSKNRSKDECNTIVYEDEEDGDEEDGDGAIGRFQFRSRLLSDRIETRPHPYRTKSCEIRTFQIGGGCFGFHESESESSNLFLAKPWLKRINVFRSSFGASKAGDRRSAVSGSFRGSLRRQTFAVSYFGEKKKL